MENSPPEAWQLWISKSWISDNMYHIYGKLLLKPKSRELLTSIFMRPQNRLTNRRIQLCKFENYLGDNMPQNWEALGELQTGLTMTGRVSSWSSSIKRASDEHPCCESFPVVGVEQWSSGLESSAAKKTRIALRNRIWWWASTMWRPINWGLKVSHPWHSAVRMAAFFHFFLLHFWDWKLNFAKFCHTFEIKCCQPNLSTF